MSTRETTPVAEYRSKLHADMQAAADAFDPWAPERRAARAAEARRVSDEAAARRAADPASAERLARAAARRAERMGR